MNHIKNLRKLLMAITDCGIISLNCSCDSGNPNDYSFKIVVGADETYNTRGYEKLSDAADEAKKMITAIDFYNKNS